MNEYRFLVSSLKEFLTKQKEIVKNTIMQPSDYETTIALRHRFEQINVIESELNQLIEKAKKLGEN